MSFLIGAIKVIFLLGFLIFIHEGGHFLMAKARGVKVKEFAIGFGPKIISKQGKETKYTLRLIPFGGYNDMLGEAERCDEEGSFSNASVGSRLAIVFAGPLVNIVFGILVYFVLMSFTTGYASTTISEIVSDYSENLSELQAGDEILEINGNKIHLKSDIDSAISECGGKDVTLKINRDGEELEVTATPTAITTKTLGVYFSTSSSEPVIKYIESGSAAEEAGLEVDDEITNINGIEIKEYSDISSAVSASDEETIAVEVQRDGETLSFDVEPTDYVSYALGIYLEESESTVLNNVHYAYWSTVYFLRDTVDNVKTIVTGNADINQMVGPIGISEMVVESSGVYNFVYLLSVISLSLGVTNLLPVPALDGGRILILLIEGVRRKPLKEEVEMKIQMIGFTFLMLLALYISYKDILRIF